LNNLQHQSLTLDPSCTAGILDTRAQGGSARITKIKKINERAFSSKTEILKN
jgi:hypothetical protein